MKKQPPRKRDRNLIEEAQRRNFPEGHQSSRPRGPLHNPPKSGVTKPMLIVGGILALVVGSACACGNIGDDDCDSMSPAGEQVFAAGFSGLQAAPPAAREEAGAVPAVGGFGTHLASCGG